MMDWREEGEYLVVTFKPSYKDEDFMYLVKRKTSGDNVINFKTATTGMNIIRSGRKVLMEKLCVDGVMRYMEVDNTRQHFGDQNFENIGWQGPSGRRYARIDVYTGEYVIVED